MLKTETGIIEGHNGMDIPYRYIKQEKPSTKLAFVFPGLGYTSQAPLLYYCTSLLVSKGYDVVHVNYEYQKPSFQSLIEEEKQAAFHYNAEVAIKAFQNKQYIQTVLIGKSIGTLSISLSLECVQADKIVWLTPLINRDDVYENMLECKVPSLAIIGDHDPCYINERWKNYSISHKTYLVQDANHSLDIGNKPFESIKVLDQVMLQIEDFIEI